MTAGSRQPGEPIASDALTGTERWAAEHARGMHLKFKPRACTACHPDGAALPVSTAPAPIVVGRERPRPPHRFQASQAFDGDERLCICGEVRSGHATGPGGRMESLGEAIERVRRRLGRPFAAEPADPVDHQVALDGGPWCEVCRGTRWVRREDLPVFHPEFGQAVSCPGCFESFVLQRRLDKLWGELPELFRDWTLDTFPAAHPAQVAVLGLAHEWIVDESLPWLFLYGPPGRGKTGLAIGLLKGALGRLRTGTFKQTRPLLARIRQTYRSREAYEADETDLLESLYSADLLVIDDLGAEDETDWVAGKLFEVIGGRHDRRRQTIITSNFNLDQLKEAIGHPTASRIQEMVGGRWAIDFRSLPDLRRTT